MHRTHQMPKAVCRGLLMALVLGVGPMAVARAQEARPGPVAGATPSLVVPIGGTQRLQMSQKQPITRAINNSEIVAKLSSVFNDPTSVLVTGLEPGVARISLIDAAGREERFEIIVQLDVEYLKSLIKRAVPTSNVDPIPGANRSIILTGTVARAEDADTIVRTTQLVLGEGAGAGAPGGGSRVVNAMRVSGVHQVQVCVVVARVNRSEARQLGFSFLQTGQRHFLSSTVAGGGSLAGTIFPSVTAPTSTLSGVPNAIFGIINDNEGFVGFLNALRTEGVAKILVEPRVTTMSGQPSYIVSGGETPILTANQNGVSVSYRQFGAVVNFLPIVVGNGRIYMQVRPEVSNRNAANDIVVPSAFGTTVVPGFDTQSASVAVEVEPGQTIAIGGLISHRTDGTISKVPILGDLPFLGAAFSAKQFIDTEEELIILVTPYLVDGMTCDQLPKYLPGMETRNPDDFELFLEGILEAPRGPRDVRHGRGYTPAFKNSPTASQYPCANGTCGNGASGACLSGNAVSGHGATLHAGTPAPAPVAVVPASASEPPVAGPTTPAASPVTEPAPVVAPGGEAKELPTATPAPAAEAPAQERPQPLPPLPPTRSE